MKALNKDYMDNHEYGFGFEEHIGETVTIFTTSGGQSGAGFTGVILHVDPCFVRLVTRIGPPPACSLGNSCCGFRNSFNCGGFVHNVGSVVDIPINRIASVVYNSV